VVDIILLDPGEAPPGDERRLVFEWRTVGMGASVVESETELRYVVAPNKHAFWSREARYLARRLGFGRVYYLGLPIAPR
jgi:hypothetical protein